MTQRVIVPIDGSETANQVIPEAAAVLGADGELILLRVIPEARAITAGLTATEIAPAADVREWETNAARTDLEIAAQGVAIDPARLRTEIVANDDPAQQIIQSALAEQATLIAMTTHGRGAVGRWLFGSVADRVARTSPIPVLLVRPDSARVREAPLIRRIVIPYDGSALAAEAFPVAAALSQQVQAPVRLVRAVYAPATPVPEMVLANVTAAAEADAGRNLEAAVAQLAELGVTATWEIRQGSPFFAISAAAQPGDVLVLASHGETGLRRWLLGSVAEKLIREAPVPVILVPAGNRRQATESGPQTA